MDPLFQNLVLDYIKLLSKNDSNRIFHVITFEQPEYFIPENEKTKIKKELKQLNIHWHPLKFHTGRFLLIKKLYDLIQAIVLILKLRFIEKTKVIFSFACVSASYSIIFSKLLRMKMIIFSYEPHSEFMAELNLWSRNSLKYKILHKLELLAGLNAEYVLTGTKYMVDHLTDLKAKGQLFRAPTGINEKLFYPTPESLALKKQLQLENKKILFYIGKFGDLYFTREVPFLFKTLKRIIPELHFVVVTPTDIEEVKIYFEEEKINCQDYTLLEKITSRNEVNKHIGIADIALSAVPPTPSQKFRSPTKVGEYLMCGVPYITCKGVSEDDLYAQSNNVGIVINSFTENEILGIGAQLKKYLSEPKETLQKRCRVTGIEYRSQKAVVDILESIYSEL